MKRGPRRRWPGLYAAVTFPKVVAVPAPIDPDFVVSSGARIPNARVIEPPMMLVPLGR